MSEFDDWHDIEYRHIQNPAYDREDIEEAFNAGKPQWISVEDRFPDNARMVPVLLDWRELDTDAYGLEVDGEWYFSKSVTHWLDAPEPPKQDDTHPDTDKTKA